MCALKTTLSGSTNDYSQDFKAQIPEVISFGKKSGSLNSLETQRQELGGTSLADVSCVLAVESLVSLLSDFALGET